MGLQNYVLTGWSLRGGQFNILQGNTGVLLELDLGGLEAVVRGYLLLVAHPSSLSPTPGWCLTPPPRTTKPQRGTFSLGQVGRQGQLFLLPFSMFLSLTLACLVDAFVPEKLQREEGMEEAPESKERGWMHFCACGARSRLQPLRLTRATTPKLAGNNLRGTRVAKGAVTTRNQPTDTSTLDFSSPEL